ncbi:MAG: aminoacetone oxidase family FAD-binding enzyme, partial [Candidatus Scatosoma sp.]
YFTLERNERGKIERAVKKFPPESLRAFLLSLGCVTFADDRGRVYPLSRQASSVTDCLRAEAKRRGVNTVTGEEVTLIRRGEKAWKIVTQNGEYAAENVLLCTGGRAAKHFGSDGGGYALAQYVGHSVTKTFPALVQIRCAEKEIRALKGIRVFDGEAALYISGAETARQRGDILFTDYGVSGDCAFKISSFLPRADAAEANVVLSLDFLPDLPENTLKSVLASKRERYKNAEDGELFTGILNNRIGETLARRVREKQHGQSVGRDGIALLAKEAKAFTLTVRGTAGFDNAQVTKGGVPLAETDGNFQSVFAKNLYFAGEILDVDGACGGYNLQWAYSSACVAGEDMAKKSPTGRVSGRA